MTVYICQSENLLFVIRYDLQLFLKLYPDNILVNKTKCLTIFMSVKTISNVVICVKIRKQHESPRTGTDRFNSAFILLHA